MNSADLRRLVWGGGRKFGIMVLFRFQSDFYGGLSHQLVIYSPPPPGRDPADASAISIALSVGELPEEFYHMLREAGADRYLLRIESSNPEWGGGGHVSFILCNHT